MAYIEIVNDHNTILIDDNFVNLCLIQRGQLALSNQTNAGRYTTLYYESDTAYSPLLALQIPWPHTVLAYKRTGNLHEWLIAGAATAAGTYDYFIFDVPRKLAGTGDLVCWNEQGEVTFDSAGKYMRVAGFYQVGYNDNMGSAALPAGRAYAIVHSGSAWRSEERLLPSPPNPANPNSPGPWLYAKEQEIQGMYVSGNTINWQRFLYTGGQVQHATAREGYAFRSDRGAAMVIDLTGY